MSVFNEMILQPSVAILDFRPSSSCSFISLCLYFVKMNQKSVITNKSAGTVRTNALILNTHKPSLVLSEFLPTIDSSGTQSDEATKTQPPGHIHDVKIVFF